MKSTRFWGMFLLAIWMIAWGVLNLGVVSVPWFDVHKVMAGMGIVAGVLLLINR